MEALAPSKRQRRSESSRTLLPPSMATESTTTAKSRRPRKNAAAKAEPACSESPSTSTSTSTLSVQRLVQPSTAFPQPQACPLQTLRALPLGFRFRPTETELVAHYLRNKHSGTLSPAECAAVRDADVLAFDPVDLVNALRGAPAAGDAQQPSECFFFWNLRARYANTTRASRCTPGGYWKATGSDKEIVAGGATIGYKKTLVFYLGKAPSGARTPWVMHEYRAAQGGPYVVCRVGLKAGAHLQEPTLRDGAPAPTAEPPANRVPEGRAVETPTVLPRAELPALPCPGPGAAWATEHPALTRDCELLRVPEGEFEAAVRAAGADCCGCPWAGPADTSTLSPEETRPLQSALRQEDETFCSVNTATLEEGSSWRAGPTGGAGVQEGHSSFTEHQLTEQQDEAEPLLPDMGMWDLGPEDFTESTDALNSLLSNGVSLDDGDLDMFFWRTLDD